jgi:pimeloyl-ACP methyl ester carboxylesterase
MREETMRTLAVALTICVVALFCDAPVASADDTTCSGVIKGTAVTGNVIVPKNASCILDTTSVTGDVLVLENANLSVQAYVEPSTIGGNVLADHCASTLLEGTVTVGGDLQILNCAAKSGFAGPGIKIGGSFLCQDNLGSCEAWLGEIKGNAQIQNNRSTVASDVSLSMIGGDLQCQQNTPAPTHDTGPDWVTGKPRGQCSEHLGFQAVGTSIVPPGTVPAKPVECEDLVNLSGFPVPNTQITSAVLSAATTTLPAHCQVDGIINPRIGSDGCNYGDGFEVRLPVPEAWNGRFMFQGGGGTEGAVPAATGSAGTLSPTLAHGWAVASQDGGHENSQLAKCASGSPNQFYLDAQGVIDFAYQSIQVTTLTAKYLIAAYYGAGPDRSYWVGCSTGGRQAMVMSQTFPQYYDGIVAGDPVYDLEAISFSELWGLEKILAITPTPITYTPTTPPAPLLYPAFPLSDQQLFTSAILQACDGLDGTVDGVIDNLPACKAKFDPATYVFTDTKQPLQCTGVKLSTCLSAAQVSAVKQINQGPRTSSGETIEAPAGAVAQDHPDNTVLGYAYDGGYMSSAGIPARKIGTATTPPGDFGQGASQIGWAWLSPPDPTFDILGFNFDTDTDLMVTSSPVATNSSSLDIERFIGHDGKIIWYHGLSDPGPPVLGTIHYYDELAGRHGGLRGAAKFSRFYPIPNMGHCGGGPATDQFDMLSPLVQWVENGVAPGNVVATGVNFTTAPTTRQRPLCPYPQQARFIGGLGGDLSVATNYECIMPPGR